jgi:hypothetical protein
MIIDQQTLVSGQGKFSSGIQEHCTVQFVVIGPRLDLLESLSRGWPWLSLAKDRAAWMLVYTFLNLKGRIDGRIGFVPV